MPPIAKENQTLSATAEISPARTPATNARPNDTVNRPQPVALEVPVTVNGARTVEGSDKREPFSESTKTVLIFGNGAVIRLSSPVAPGQLLFLTNEKTKKEVVCQVVKSKNYRNVSGYVELEFTEPVVGFWGMRFPGDRIATPSPAARATGSPTSVPSASKLTSPMGSATSKTPDLRPAPIPLPAKPFETKARQATSSIPAVNAIPAAPNIPKPNTPARIEVAKTPNISEVKPDVPAVPAITLEPASAPAEGSTEALRLRTALVQEQLSSLLFSDAPAATPQSPAEAALHREEVSQAAAKIFQMADAEPTAAEPMPPAKLVPPPVKSSLDTDEVKIPAWLEPLARNAAAPASTQELIERGKTKLAAQSSEPEEPETNAVSVLPEPEIASLADTQEPAFGSRYLQEEESSTQEGASAGSRKGLWIGLAAAGFLAAAGGGWYFLRQPSPVPQTPVVTAQASPTTQPSQPVTQSVLPTPIAPASNSSSNNAVSSKPEASLPVANQQTSRVTVPNGGATNEKLNPKTGPNTQETPRGTSKGTPHTVPAAETEDVRQPVQPEQKKPALGEVRLAKPKVNRSAAHQENGISEPSLSAGDTSDGAELGSGLAINNTKQPVAPEAPLPVGGDVKPAKLASSVSPIYPAIARSQHVSGDVKVDALIDTEGRVTTMKVLSGPTLLHQSAMDALRQWKYQPATLDGKPVSMHLTVTLQFRLQ